MRRSPQIERREVGVHGFEPFSQMHTGYALNSVRVILLHCKHTKCWERRFHEVVIIVSIITHSNAQHQQSDGGTAAALTWPTFIHPSKNMQHKKKTREPLSIGVGNDIFVVRCSPPARARLFRSPSGRGLDLSYAAERRERLGRFFRRKTTTSRG